MQSDLVETYLENVIIGDSIRIFNISKDENFTDKISSFITKELIDSYKDISVFDISEDNVNQHFSYFLDNDKLQLNSNYDENTINKFKKESSNNRSFVYYNENLNNITNDKRLFQSGSKYFFKSKNIFTNEKLINSFYDRNNKTGISEYISTNYNINFYNNNLKFVNDKSIPIYELNKNSLEKIDILKINNISSILNIIETYNLESISGEILYNSKTNTKSVIEYDSLLIKPIINFLDEDQMDSFFNTLFSNLSLNSFYRFLIPVGKINKVLKIDYNNQSFIYDNSTNIQQYVNYINADNIISFNENQKFNYYSLKNLLNPHDEYDYIIGEYNNDISCKTNAYEFEENIKYNFLSFFDNFKCNFRKFLKSSHATTISAQYINDNNLTSSLINLSKKLFNNWNDDIINNAMNDENSWIRVYVFNKFFKIKYNKILKNDPYIITSGEILDFIDNNYNTFLSSLFEITNEDITDLKFNLDEIFNSTYKNQVIDESLSSSINYFYKYKNIGETIFNEYYKALFDIGENGILADISLRNAEVLNFVYYTQINLILNDLDNFSQTYNNYFDKENENYFKKGLYKSLSNNILNAASVNDTYLSETNENYAKLFKYRMDSKLKDYKNSFVNYFEHENIFKVSGAILGYREYDENINASLNNNFYITYSYNTVFDKSFYNSIFVDDQVDNLTVSKIFEKYEQIENPKISAYFKTLDEIKKYKFIDYIEGYNKYREESLTKANVYSLELKNSNLNYELYTFNEMKIICFDKLKKQGYVNIEFDEDSGQLTLNEITSGFLDVIHGFNFKEILDVVNDENINLLNKLNVNIPLNSFKYYNVENQLNENIHTKMELRKSLETAIRKSMKRYAPGSTVLWKINYTGI